MTKTRVSFRMPLIVFTCLLGAVASVYGLYSVSDTGEWPESWPEELKPLRAKSATFVGPTMSARHFHIPFATRAEFEAAWPHLLKVKSKGAPVILVKSPYTWIGRIDAGVIVHAPPATKAPREEPPVVEEPIKSNNPRIAWKNGNYMELIVDGEIVDLNRIKLPNDCRIIDERFKEPLPRVAPSKKPSGTKAAGDEVPPVLRR